jgi:hypothetical protein
MSRQSLPICSIISQNNERNAVKVLLINPNRYLTPPAPPIGLEYLAGACASAGHECHIVDLTFEDDPGLALDRALDNFKPSIAGFTVRNIDTVLYENNEFFLDDISVLVKRVKMRGIPVILGGAGFSFAPEEILAYLGADWGVSGPGEQALPSFLDQYKIDLPAPGTIIDGFAAGIDPYIEIPRGVAVDYPSYLSSRALAGFETQKGCMGNCPYCLECNRNKLIFRNASEVVAEIRQLADRGITSFHLCDTEFNQNLTHCTTFLRTLIDTGPKIDWALYLRSWPYNEDLFRLLARSGANLATLSLPTGEDWLNRTKAMVQYGRDNGIRLAIDLLVGFPWQARDDVARIIDTLRSFEPSTVGVNSTFRLLKGLPLTKWVMESPGHRKHLLGAVDDNPDFLKPVFYRWLDTDMLGDLIGGDPLFKIEGFERTSNYERV